MEPTLVLSPNPGGVLEPYEVVGRHGLIDRYWQVLERRSLVLLTPLTPSTVDALVERLVHGPEDRLHLEHYLTRLAEMDWREAAEALLDAIARSGSAGLSLAQLDNLLPDTDRAALATRLLVLRRDGYVTEERGQYRFLLRFLARWWCHRRGLGA